VHVDLLVPVKPLAQAKTRLRGAAGAAAPAHARLALALARDTIAAAAGASTVRRVLAICSDELVRAALAEDGVEAVPDEPAAGLNPALRHGERELRADDAAAAVGVLPADLPALRPAELDAAVLAALAGGGRAFCPDRAGSGTTLLLAAPGHALDPRFGAGSAAAHRAAGASELTGDWPGLRCDVDTGADLAVARRLGARLQPLAAAIEATAKSHSTDPGRALRLAADLHAWKQEFLYGLAKGSSDR
jgi:2-phospho-L-lactate guanylyltransferase